ncbi:hypothetical protein ACH9L7_10505 [Haloferax sp. S1W]|uniref:hypothetical protein n=1 Tax=Haloferax sp. S1W TaxID=3377110 RepID=UPI0037CAE0A4
MSRYSSLLDPYRDRNVAITLGVIALILFFGGFVAMYEAHLRGVYHHTVSLSSFEWVAYGAGAFLFEPIVLFVVLFVVARRFDSPLDVQSILPGVVVVTLTGTLLGQTTGTHLFRTGASNLSLELLARRAFWRSISFDLFAIRLWRFALELVTFDLLTIVAALSLGTLTRDRT